jgi:hypothetical protein
MRVRAHIPANNSHWVAVAQNVIKIMLQDSSGEVKIPGQLTEA